MGFPPLYSVQEYTPCTLAPDFEVTNGEAAEWGFRAGMRRNGRAAAARWHGLGMEPGSQGRVRTVFCTGELSFAVRTERREKSRFPPSSAPVPSLDRTYYSMPRIWKLLMQRSGVAYPAFMGMTAVFNSNQLSRIQDLPYLL